MMVRKSGDGVPYLELHPAQALWRTLARVSVSWAVRKHPTPWGEWYEDEEEAVSLHDVRPPVPREDEAIERGSASKDATGERFGISKSLIWLPSRARCTRTLLAVVEYIQRRGACLRTRCFPVFFLFFFAARPSHVIRAFFQQPARCWAVCRVPLRP